MILPEQGTPISPGKRNAELTKLRATLNPETERIEPNANNPGGEIQSKHKQQEGKPVLIQKVHQEVDSGLARVRQEEPPQGKFNDLLFVCQSSLALKYEALVLRQQILEWKMASSIEVESEKESCLLVEILRSKLITADETIEDFDDQENKLEMGIVEETEDTSMDQQNDSITYVNDAIKEGTRFSIFRKENTGEDGKGTAYWYDGDSTIVHRLYKEITKVEFMKMKGKGRLTQPTSSYQWETLTTNLEEFKQIFVSAHVDRPDHKITIFAFTNALLVNRREKMYLVLNKPTTLEDMNEKVNGFIDLERMVTDRQKTQKSTLLARDQSTGHDFNRAADDRGDRMINIYNEDRPWKGSKMPKPYLPKITVTIANIYPTSKG
ncbi:hypothetical protein GIB67_000300 [Kingdonia uniflora]|uniref:Uncharacterized protein n=1 Tax=Kingdonia uniflora TaxID=39325 RepID=A0A7J7LCG2_9MAGN|nr:hypothetical protein GIB67_000300 [Kingdonia uniflora]